MPHGAEQELADFMAPLPLWLRKILWHDHSSMTELQWVECVDSITPFTADQLQELKVTAGWQPDRYPETAEELRPRFEQILQRCDRAEWRRYRDNAEAIRNSDANRYVRLPRDKQGRPRKDALADEAGRLKKDGLSHQQIANKLRLAHVREDATRESVRKLLSRARKSAGPSADKK